MAFAGEQEGVIDANGRLTLPSVYGELRDMQPYATLLSNGLLAVWPEIEFNKQADAIDAKTADDPAAQRELRTFMSSAAKLKFDNQRRATIPEFLRKRWTIGPGTAVTYVGVRDRVEVWATDAWRAYLQAEAPVA